MDKKKTKQEDRQLQGGDKEITINDVVNILNDFVRTIILCSPDVAHAAGPVILDIGDDPKALDRFFNRVAIYVMSSEYTRGDIVKDSKGNEKKMKPIEVGQRIVDFLGLNHWVLTDILTGRAKMDEDGNIVPEPFIPFDQLK